jgi:hypothetical protein
VKFAAGPGMMPNLLLRHVRLPSVECPWEPYPAESHRAKKKPRYAASSVN